MSKLILRDQADVDVPQFIDRLTQEFIHYDDPDPEYRQPLISVDRRGQHMRLLIIWDAWRTLSQQERSHLTMEAYKAARGEEAALDVSIVMGFTQEEAAQLGIGFEPAKA